MPLFAQNEDGTWEYEQGPHPWRGERSIGVMGKGGHLIPDYKLRKRPFNEAAEWCPICYERLDEWGTCFEHDYAAVRECHQSHEPYWWENVTLADGQRFRVMCGGGYLE